MFLSLKKITKSYGQGDSLTPVLKGIDLDLSRGSLPVIWETELSSVSFL